MAVAERIKAERIKALHGHGVQDWETVKQGSQLLTGWIKKYCEGGVSTKKSTLHCRIEMLHTVEKYLEESNQTFITLEEVNADFCRGYVKFLRTFPNSHCKYIEPRPISQNTASRYLGMFSTTLNNAVRQGIIRNNPMKELDAKERIQSKDGKKEYLTIEELKVLMATDSYRPKLNQSQNLRRLFSLSIQVVKQSKSGFLTRSRTSSSMKPRFPRAMTLQQSRTFHMLQCCSLQGTSMQPYQCPFLAEVVAAHLPLVGARRMMRMTVSMLAVVSRWLMLSASQDHKDDSTDKQIPHINEKNKQYRRVRR